MDGPPPLEDCSHIFTSSAKEVPTKKVAAKKKKKKTGLRRGFLNNPKKSKLLISNNQKEAEKKEGKVFDDVQEAMKKATGDLHKDADFVESIVDDEERMKIMMTPKFQAALKAFQNNPSEALQTYGQDAEIMSVIRWFSGRMGDELTKRGESEEKKETTPLMKEVSRTVKKPPQRKIGPAQMQQWLANPQLRNILSNGEIQSIIQRLQAFPHELPKYANHPGIQILIEHGIIQT